MEQNEINIMRIALREIIINAIEHGNLEITFEDKTRTLIEDQYFQLVSERQHDARYANRKIIIEYSIGPEKAAYTIIDEGSGFDYSLYLSADPETENKKMFAHGRGIAMAKEFFDEMDFNEAGNKTVLVKYFR